MNAKQVIEFLSTYDSNTEVKVVIKEEHQLSIHSFIGGDLHTGENSEELTIAIVVDLTNTLSIQMNQN